MGKNTRKTHPHLEIALSLVFFKSVKNPKSAENTIKTAESLLTPFFCRTFFKEA